MYASVSGGAGSTGIVGFRRNTEDGTLSRHSILDSDRVQAGAMCTDPGQRYLFAACRGGTIASFRIRPPGELDVSGGAAVMV